MQVTFLVTVEIARRDAQPLTEFIKQDGKAFIPYLKEKIEDSLRDNWQYNALVDKVTVKKVL